MVALGQACNGEFRFQIVDVDGGLQMLAPHCVRRIERQGPHLAHPNVTALLGSDDTKVIFIARAPDD